MASTRKSVGKTNMLSGVVEAMVQELGRIAVATACYAGLGLGLGLGLRVDEGDEGRDDGFA